MFLILIGILYLTNAQQIDDSDYDVEYYDDFPNPLEKSVETKVSMENNDDFYIVNEKVGNSEFYETGIDDKREFDNRNIIDTSANKYSEIFFVDSLKTATSSPKREIWHENEEKIYRYTKHRIPGYDYDELDIFGDSADRKCNEKSIWTHCLCQFTCDEQNSVDCFLPCESGCECREDFVFDKTTGKCVLPSECEIEMPADYFYDFET